MFKCASGKPFTDGLLIHYLHKVSKGGAVIWSVKRTSDSEIFKVGDYIKGSVWRGKITKFETFRFVSKELFNQLAI
ncbi:MAG: hypothetical protein WD512_04935, partial [Candidatus Paceibacterota bacterium]